MDKGFLYVANNIKYLTEAKYSIESLKVYNTHPVAIVTTKELASQVDFADQVIINNDIARYSYLSKVIGLKYSPFDRTVFLDTDTYVCDNLDELFEVLDLFDLATTQEAKKHTLGKEKLEGLKYKFVIPEYNSGVIVFQKKTALFEMFDNWMKKCLELELRIDMPGLREAIIESKLRVHILPEEYNLHGFKTSLIINGRAKIIHERFGEKLNSLTPVMLPYKKMRKYELLINKIETKRIYIHHVGVLPYNWNLYSIIHKAKKILGVKRTSKRKAL